MVGVGGLLGGLVCGTGEWSALERRVGGLRMLVFDSC